MHAVSRGTNAFPAVRNGRTARTAVDRKDARMAVDIIGVVIKYEWK